MSKEARPLRQVKNGLMSKSDSQVEKTATTATKQIWSCHMCSYDNPETSASCQICEAKRVSASMASGQWQCERCTFINEKSLTKCGACSTAKPTSSSDSWACQRCTFANEKNAPSCSVCGLINGSNAKNGVVPQRLSTAQSGNDEPPMLLPVRQESEFMEALRSIDEGEALDQYRRILTFCKENKQPFVDDSFPPTLRSLKQNINEADGVLTSTRWLRPSRILTSERRYTPWTIFSNPKPTDIVQGILGNCWFLSALAVVAERADLLSNIVITKHTCPEGVYLIRLCVDGQWRIVVVDDLIPCTPRGAMIFSKAKRNQLWVPLMEKALAKVYGSYAALTAGRTVEGLASLTGAPCEALKLPGSCGSDSSESDPDVIWAQLLSCREAGFLMGASCGGNHEQNEAEYHLVGLEPLHAYSVLDVKEVHGVRLVKLRNPWGHFEWNGAWSEHSSLWTPELLAYLLPEGFRDGVFWMPYEDFCRYFDSVDVCRVRSSWRELRFAGLLPPHCRRNFVYVAEIAVQEPTEVDVTLYQQNFRNEKPSKHGVLDLVVMVFSVDAYGRPNSLVARSDHALRPFVVCNAFLQPGQYITIWAAFNHWGMQLSGDETPKCVVALHSARALVAQVRSVSPMILADCMNKMFLREALVSEKDIPGITVRYLTKHWTGLAVMAENHLPDAILNIRCDCSESQNAVGTRGSLITEDKVPPGHRQMLIVLTQVEGSAASTFSYRVRYTLESTLRNGLRNYADRFLSFVVGGDASLPPSIAVQPVQNHIPELDENVYGLHAPRPIDR